MTLNALPMTLRSDFAVSCWRIMRRPRRSPRPPLPHAGIPSFTTGYRTESSAGSSAEVPIYALLDGIQPTRFSQQPPALLFPVVGDGSLLSGFVGAWLPGGCG